MRRRTKPVAPLAVPVSAELLEGGSFVEDWIDITAEVPPRPSFDDGMTGQWFELQAYRRLQAAQDGWLTDHGIDPQDRNCRRALGMAQNPRWRSWPDLPGHPGPNP